MNDRAAERPSPTAERGRCACGAPCLACAVAKEVAERGVCVGDVFLRGYLAGLEEERIGHLCPDHRARFEVTRQEMRAEALPTLDALRALH